MLTVLVHEIVSYLLYRQNPSRFLTANVGHDPGNLDREKDEESRVYQDLTLELLQCCDVESLGSAVRNGLESYIPEAYGGALFYVDESNGDVITADNAGLSVCSPPPLCVKQAYGEKQQIILNVETAPACVLEQVTNNGGRSFTSQTKVLCSPVQKGQNSTVSAVLVVAIDEISNKVAEKLAWLEKQIAACYSHIQRTFQGRAAEERASQQLIKLCGELYDQDAAQLQLKVLKYLEDQTQAECAFLLLVVPETQELFCQVIGKRILEEEIRFPGQSSSFSVALETKQPLNLDDIPVENRKGIEEVIEVPLRSFLCVPVTSRNDDNLIALACLVNKQNGNRFSERDVTCIRQCFRYTATVLTSTLAFQNERKIKIQTQALLQVAKHLFTNLGELVTHRDHRLDTFPFIRSREWEVNVMGSCLLDAITRNRLNRKTCRSIRRIESKKKKLNSHNTSLISSSQNTSSIISSPDKTFIINHVNNITKDNSDVLNSTKKDENDNENTIGFCNDEEIVMRGFKTCHKSLDESPIKANKKDNRSIDSADELTQNQLDSGQDGIQPNTPVILMPDAHLDSDTRECLDVKNNTIDRLDKALLSPKQTEDNEEGSDYASVYTHESDNIWNSFHGPDEVDSFVSCITTADFDDSTFEDTANVSLKVHCDTEVTDNTVDNDSASLDLFTDDPRHRQAFNDDIPDGDCQPGNVRLSNSEPCFHDAPILYDSRPDLNNAFLTDNRDTGHGTTDNDRQFHKQSAVKHEGQSGHDTDAQADHDSNALAHPETDAQNTPSVLITLDKVDISDIQAPATDLTSITENDLTKLLREVMAQARNLTQAERCSVFLIDDETDELVAKVFDGISTTKDNEVLDEIRLPSTQGIAGHVATSGELLNIKDAYSHPLFYRGIDDSTGFRTRNILCFPIKNDAGKIMGVAQLCNKKTGPFFTQFDEDLATAFGIYCCISISHSLLYKKVIDSQVRNSLANELMMYHMKSILYKRMKDSQHRKSLANELMIYHMQVSPEDVTGLTSVDIPHPRLLHSDFVEFSYAPRSLPESKTLLACLSMFEDLNLISRYRIKRESLARFILMVKKGYRNPPYHNWTHAYTVAQFCYQLVKNMNLNKHLEEIEIFAIFVSCLCHDIDHRGTNNSFQTASKSVLAALYSSEGSVLERHHFAQTMCILNTEGCNIFEHLTSKEYQQVLDLIRDIILATDLAHHLKILKTLREMAARGYDRNQTKDRKLLLCLLMTSCDLSDQTKPWDNTKNVAALIYKEFFTQGDLEKASGFQPAEMFDRERAQIPEVQIGFLDHIALPVYKVLSDLFPEGHEISEAVENNKRHWEKIRNLIKLRRGGSCARMTFDEVIAIENESDDVEMSGSSEQLNHSVSNGSG